MNLIICCTPLQVLIAEKIIALHPKQEFFGIMLDSLSNDKFRFYEDRLRYKCKSFLAIKHADTKLDKLNQILSLLKIRNKKFNKVFIASIDKPIIHIILTNSKFKELYTFDDGTANIVKSSLYYKYVQYPSSYKMRIIEFILGNNFDIDKIKEKSKLHYSIYSVKENIINNIEYIPLLESSDAVDKRDKKTVKILLGQPIFNDSDRNIELIKNVFDKFDIDYYFPHPRERYKIDDISYIDTPLIFEDFYLENSIENDIEVYTFFSSAVLNILNDTNISKIYAIKPNINNEAYLSCYDILEKFGIKIIEI